MTLPRGGADPPTSPTIDAPSWLRPGAQAAALAVGSSPDTMAGLSPPARRIAQFTLRERIGAGGMGEVFAAFDDKLEREVAIKLVALRSGDDRDHQRLLREAQALARLSHPNAVTVYQVGTLPGGGLFIAMELVKGLTLRAWQKAPGRTCQDIVAAYAAAGCGLAAAHAAGIIHCDFKPDNVLVGDDGRVRVADFGLAFAASGPGTSGAGLEPDARRVPEVAGSLGGTPGYMAPEQLAGGAGSARADQYSFCVALYEALHGERPGDGPPRRASAGRGAEPSYPRRVGRALRRGLSRDPDQRFATMDALLARLTGGRERRRRRLLAAGITGALVTVGSIAVRPEPASPPPCPRATGDLGGVWDAATRQRSQAAILGTGAPFAASTWTSTAPAFDRYAQRWLGARQAVCEATHVRHVQSAELLDRRMECLASGRRSLAAAVEVLQRRPMQAVTHADELLGTLGDIERCADPRVLWELPGPDPKPASAAVRARTAEVRQQLARARALLATDDVASAEPVVADAGRLARELDDDAVRAELLYVQGFRKLLRGEVAGAIAVFNDAVALAVASHDDELPAEIWLMLALGAGDFEQRPAEIAVWVDHAEAWLRRLGHARDPRRVTVEHARANLQRAAGDARGAEIALSRALDTAMALWGKDDPRLIPLLRDRATTRGLLHQGKPAVADAERALALGITAWGPEYPGIARTRRALGLLCIEQLGDVARGEHELTLALELYRAQLGDDSIEVANCEQGLSKAGMDRGDYAAALRHAERAEQIYVRGLGADHYRRGEALNGVGVLRFMRKDFAGSLAAYNAAYPILRTALGPEHTTVGVLLSNTGETLLALGQPEPALADFTQALAILEHSLGPQHPDLALPLKGLGLAHLGRGRSSDAIAPLERALALAEAASADGPQELAEIRWGLARALRAVRRELPRARALAEAALAAYRQLGPESRDKAQAISRWLATL